MGKSLTYFTWSHFFLGFFAYEYRHKHRALWNNMLSPKGENSVMPLWKYIFQDIFQDIRRDIFKDIYKDIFQDICKDICRDICKDICTQSSVEQHALPRGWKSDLLVSRSSLPLPLTSVTLPGNQVHLQVSRQHNIREQLKRYIRQRKVGICRKWWKNVILPLFSSTYFQ